MAPPMANARISFTQKSGSYYHDMEEMLRRRLKDEPANWALRFNLLELYYETARQKDFVKEARHLQQQLADPENSTEWRKVMSMGRMLVPADPMFQQAEGAVEFISPLSAGADQSGFRRIGEGEKYHKHFAALGEAFERLSADRKFLADFDMQLVRLAGRPSSLLHAARLSQHLHGAQIYFKREDLSPQYPHLVINLVGQMLVAKRLGKKTVVLGSNQGHTGVIAASVAAHFGLNAVVYMHSQDIARNSANVFKMWLMGAQVETAHVKLENTDTVDVRQAAVEHWARNAADTFLVMGLDAAPHPYPTMAQQFTGAIGRECRRQALASAPRLPDVLVARGGDSADAIGFFAPFLNEQDTQLVCVEQGDSFGESVAAPNPQMQEAIFDPRMHRLSEQETRKAGTVLDRLEYPSVRREHALLKASGRVQYVEAGAKQAREAMNLLSRHEGIIPAIQTAYAVAWACDAARKMNQEQMIVVMLAENSDKDIWDIAKTFGLHV